VQLSAEDGSANQKLCCVPEQALNSGYATASVPVPIEALMPAISRQC